MGVQCLYRSLQAVQSRHPLIVLYTPDTLSREAAAALDSEGCVMRPVEKYIPEGGTLRHLGFHPERVCFFSIILLLFYRLSAQLSESFFISFSHPSSYPVGVFILFYFIFSSLYCTEINHGAYKNSYYMDCWTKLKLWEMVEYERVVYLDADMLCCKNIDHLFTELHEKAFWAVPDCAAGRLTEEERAACALLLASSGKRPNYFNAGMFVFTPSVALFEDFGRACRHGKFPIAGFAEQDFLNAYFKVRCI